MDLNKIEKIYQKKPIGKAENLTNIVFGKWEVLYRTKNDSNNKVMWVCQCECGTIRAVAAKSLKSGASTNCGCLRLNTLAEKADKKIHQYNEQGELILKKCSRCQKWLSPEESFWKNKTCKDGYHNECKICGSTSKESRYNIYKKNAKRRKLDFNLSKEDFYVLTSQPCHYCGDIKEYNGIDRIDSTQGYFLKNCVSCCSICNKMKLDYKYSFWLNHMKKIIKKQEGL